MNGTITGGTTAITPTIILGVSERSDSGNIVHPIPGRADPDVTLRPATLRVGTMLLGFLAEADAATAFNVLRTGGVFTLTAAARPSLGMSFVASGPIRRELDDATRNAWTVSVDYQEVVP